MRFLFVALAASAVPLMAQGQTRGLTPDQIAAAVRSEDFTIPSPGEIFSAMDALVRPSWPQWVKSEPPPALEDREQTALFLGRLVTDGYVAVEAQDAQAVKNIGKDILSLAKKLNVSQSVTGRAASINDFAEGNDWNALREELEATQNEVKLDMAEQKDDRLVTLVTVGAWVRGVHLAAQIVAQNWSSEAASVLQQPGIAAFLVERIGALPEATREHRSVVAAREALAAAAAEAAAGPPSEEGVQRLVGVTDRALEAFQQPRGKK